MQPRYEQPIQTPQRRRPLDNWTIALIVATAVAALACVCCVGAIFIFVFLKPPPPPATPAPTLDTTAIFAGQNPATPVPPTFDPSSVGKVINPYIDANLTGMTVLQIDVLDKATGTYTRAAQLTGTDLDIFAQSFNISVETVAPNTDCPDHVRLSITRADSSIVTIAVCLKGAVILRGLPDLGGADAPMGPLFTDALINYLPDEYKALLQS